MYRFSNFGLRFLDAALYITSGVTVELVRDVSLLIRGGGGESVDFHFVLQDFF